LENWKFVRRKGIKNKNLQEKEMKIEEKKGKKIKMKKSSKALPLEDVKEVKSELEEDIEALLDKEIRSYLITADLRDYIQEREDFIYFFSGAPTAVHRIAQLSVQKDEQGAFNDDEIANPTVYNAEIRIEADLLTVENASNIVFSGPSNQVVLNFVMVDLGKQNIPSSLLVITPKYILVNKTSFVLEFGQLVSKEKGKEKISGFPLNPGTYTYLLDISDPLRPQICFCIKGSDTMWSCMYLLCRIAFSLLPL